MEYLEMVVKGIFVVVALLMTFFILLQEGKGESLGQPPAGALLFSCLGRGQHMYKEKDHDSKAFHTLVGDVPLAGFFCNGEIGPVGGTTYVHGFTSCFGCFRAKS